MSSGTAVKSGGVTSPAGVSARNASSPATAAAVATAVAAGPSAVPTSPAHSPSPASSSSATIDIPGNAVRGGPSIARCAAMSATVSADRGSPSSSCTGRPGRQCRRPTTRRAAPAQTGSPHKRGRPRRWPRQGGTRHQWWLRGWGKGGACRLDRRWRSRQRQLPRGAGGAPWSPMTGPTCHRGWPEEWRQGLGTRGGGLCGQPSCSCRGEAALPGWQRQPLVANGTLWVWWCRR